MVSPHEPTPSEAVERELARHTRTTRKRVVRRKRVLSSRRELIRLARSVVRHPDTDVPRFLILHASYTDGSETYEVRSLEGEFPPRHFELKSEMQAWLRKRGHDV